MISDFTNHNCPVPLMLMVTVCALTVGSGCEPQIEDAALTEQTASALHPKEDVDIAELNRVLDSLAFSAMVERPERRDILRRWVCSAAPAANSPSALWQAVCTASASRLSCFARCSGVWSACLDRQLNPKDKDLPNALNLKACESQRSDCFDDCPR